MKVEFEPFPKIPRMRRQVGISEKLDGTNAGIQIRPMDGLVESTLPLYVTAPDYKDNHGVEIGAHGIWAQSRSQFISPKKDNYGFATWVQANADELSKLGPGAHFGEWWGYGIQRGYGAPDKRFSLFNYNRWGEGRQPLPTCCGVVPFLGYFEHNQIDGVLEDLRANGSKAIPGYMRPEGIVVYHTQSRQMYKILLEGDDIPKGQQ